MQTLSKERNSKNVIFNIRGDKDKKKKLKRVHDSFVKSAWQLCWYNMVDLLTVMVYLLYGMTGLLTVRGSAG